MVTKGEKGDEGDRQRVRSETYTIQIKYGTGDFKTEATDINAIKNQIKNGNLYTVAVTYNKANGGVIDTVTITDVTSK